MDFQELNQHLGEIKPLFTQGVHLMFVEDVEVKTDKNGEECIIFKFNTGFKTEKGEKRFMFETHYACGEFEHNGEKKSRAEIFAKFLNRCFKIKKIGSFEELKKEVVNQKVSVAVKKGGDFLEFWYAGHEDEYLSMKHSYSPKK